ncbi:pentatricopeptide repeat-containing protein At4g21300-like isoform X1 [Vitis riparia]|uniref:pentatricopeptide repeat-containing protein At4g21300-like isoform X1 n=1 Tax=Vitis riparia TaxID=96939 RepID=UPI00155A5FD1|nr:pentatricopeptide repeat-containing protein At4g21300-like isoform X1 [Vitis riparia]XP_034712051.1 pentatricopeptide repeat-containing protein At4g21300-like isoform X1 [Vitis riparia]
MVLVRPLNSPFLPLYPDQFNLQTPSKTPHHISNLVRVTSPVSCSLRFQKFNYNPIQKWSSKPLSTKIQTFVSISFANNVIREYTEDGFFDDAIGVYLKMLDDGVKVEEFRYFPCLIKAFGGLCDIYKGRQIHGHVLKLGVLDDVSVVNSLLTMYWKCGVVEDAVQMFEKMPEVDLVSWNTMISGFQKSIDYTRSLMFFRSMVWEFGIYPNRVACVSSILSCSSLRSLTHGREIHGVVVKSGLDVEEYLVSSLIEMYMKCGSIKNAENIFNSILDKDSVRRNAVIWNVMISGYVSNGCFSQALLLFIKMMVWGIKPDYSTMVSLFSLCSESLDIAFGKQIHGFIFKFGLKNNVRVETALLDMYLKCGDMGTGLKIFRRSQNHNLIMWSAVISNCAQSGCPTEALELFYEFKMEDGLADSGILVAVLRACSSLTLKPEGMQIHGLATKMGFVSDVFVGSALVDLYAKCRDMGYSKKVFLRLSQKDLVSWNALISGYAQDECADEALKAFRDMQLEEIRPNTVTIACILSVCARLSVMTLCKEVHGYLIRQGLETTVLVSNSLIATYAKCGDINSSLYTFEKMPERNDVSWNSIILGMGMHSRMDEMIVLFDKMVASGIKPDHVTFTAILSACSHAGRVDEGCKYFKSMVEDFNLKPQLEQYTCMVDLLGRAGHLNQAYDLIMAMPCTPDDRIWGSLLGSCKNHGDEILAEIVANHIFKLVPSSVGYRVLLANLYENFGKGREGSKVRSEIKDMGLKKKPGCSWIEVDNNFHIFIAGDRSHSQSDEIYAAVESLTTEIKRAGYIPQIYSY